MAETDGSATFGDKLRSLRKRKGFSQVQLAKRAGMNANHLSRLERGAGLPSTELLKRLAHELDASIDYLLSDDDETTPEVHIENKGLAERIRLIEDLDDEDQEAVFRVIDSMLTKKKMRRFLESELSAG